MTMMYLAEAFLVFFYNMIGYELTDDFSVRKRTIMHARVYFGLSALSSYITAALTNTEFSVGKRCGVKLPQWSN
jgi:hypothetical protein